MPDTSAGWKNYLAAFCGGVIIIHVVPHLLVHHLDLINLLLGLASLGIGYLFLRTGKVSWKNKTSLLLFFLGMAVILIYGCLRHHSS